MNIKSVLLELSAKIPDGIIDFKNPLQLKTLREIFEEKKYPESFIKNIINEILIKTMPERVAFNEEGYAVIFENEYEKLTAIENGDHTEESPDSNQEPEGHKDFPDLENPKPKLKLPEPPKEEPEAPEVTEPEAPTEKAEPEAVSEPEVPDAGEVEQGETAPEKTSASPVPSEKSDTEIPEPAPEEVPQKTDSTPTEPSLSDWKHSPEETRKKAESFGWKGDELGYWWDQGQLKAITTKTGYIMPILNGNKAHPQDWPESQSTSDTEPASEKVSDSPPPSKVSSEKPMPPV